ncbi:hypothetical protein Naga_101183g1 [Nannochloropsis gaditana]|uniref:Uncharacterized protein n=1 Tax=Nannochloropsis gaditana TaxID=72520 RepID=W7TIS2_9STRA|nr:hypothetical protein Naga_101183g1 [Nannochloropsis gaditana]
MFFTMSSFHNLVVLLLVLFMCLLIKESTVELQPSYLTMRNQHSEREDCSRTDHWIKEYPHTVKQDSYLHDCFPDLKQKMFFTMSSFHNLVVLLLVLFMCLLMKESTVELQPSYLTMRNQHSEREDCSRTDHWIKEYSAIYHQEMLSFQRTGMIHAVWYNYGDGSGWGNRLRATHFVLLLGLLTRRPIFVSHPDWNVHFDQPFFQGRYFSLDWSSQQKVMEDGGLLKKEFGLHHANYDTMCQQLDAFQGTDFHDIIPARVLEYSDGNSPDLCIFKNDKYHPWLLEMFGTTSRYNITGRLAQLYLSQPSMRLLREVDRLKQVTRI